MALVLSSVQAASFLGSLAVRSADVEHDLHALLSALAHANPAFRRPRALVLTPHARAFLCACALLSPQAQAPPKVSPKMVATSKQFAYGLPGSMGPQGEFDPANFLEGKTQLEVYRYREAELTHGRVSMLASLGFLVQENFHPLFSGDGGPAIDQIPQLPVWLWGVMTAGIGAAEAYRISIGWQELEDGTASSALKSSYYPGDINFDPLGLKPEDPAEFRLMQEKELAHCRLAMIAAAGFLAQEAVSGDTWGTWWGAPEL